MPAVDLITQAELGQLAGISRPRLSNIAAAGKLPPHHVIGGRRFFDRAVAEAWIKARAPEKRRRERRMLASMAARAGQRVSRADADALREKAHDLIKAGALSAAEYKAALASASDGRAEKTSELTAVEAEAVGIALAVLAERQSVPVVADSR